MGPGKRFAGGSRGVVARLIEHWQIGSIFNVFSGEPITLSSGVNSWNTFGDNTPVAVGPLAKSTGSLRRTGQGAGYFDGLRQAPDPSIAGLTTAQGIRERSTLQAIADSSGRLLLVHPTPGVLGNLAPQFLEGPGSFRFDLNLIQRVRISESKNLEFRADAINFTNSPDFDNPNTDISSPNFGRITGAGGNRVVVVGVRFNF